MIEVTVAETKEDKETVVKLRKQVFVEEQGLSYDIKRDSYDDVSILFLAKADGMPVGTGRFRIYHSFLKFERIAVTSAARGRDVGKYLLRNMQNIGRQKYPKYLPMMHAQVTALDFYKKLGWVEIGEIFMDEKIEHIMMIFPPVTRFDVDNLKCLTDPNTPKEIIEYLKTI